jgi:hypothetical protein
MAVGNLGSLVVSLGLNAAEFVQGLTRSEYLARQSMRNIEREVASVQATIQSFTRNLAAISGGVISVAGVIAAFEAIKRATIESEQSIAQLNATLKATQGAAGLTAGDLEELGRGLRASTTFSTEDIRAAETALLRFRDIRKEVFERALGQLPDLAVILRTTLPEAAAIYGRALEGSTRDQRALKEAGVILSETQLALIKHFSELGEKAEANRILMDAVAASTGGAAKAATEGLLGATDRLARAFKDLQTSAGKQLFGTNHAEVESLTGLLERLAERVAHTNLNLVRLFTEPFALAKQVIAEVQALARGYQPEAPSPRTTRGVIRGLEPAGLTPEQDAARQAALQADIERRIDAQTIHQFNALKSFAEKSAQYYAREVTVQKESLDIQQSQLEFAYAQGTVTTADYFATLEKIARQSFNNQDAIFVKRIAAENAIIGSNLSTEADRDAARARLASIANEALQAQATTRVRLNALGQQEIEAARKYGEQLDELNAKLLELSGNTAAAGAIRFDIQNRIFRAQLGAAGDTIGTARLDSLRAQQLAQDQLTDALRGYTSAVGYLGIEQARVDLAAETDSLTEIGALNKRAEVARAYIGVLSHLAGEYQRIADSPALKGTVAGDAAALQAARLRLEIDQLAASADALNKKFRDVFESGFTTFVTDLISGTKTVGRAFLDMGKSIEQSISRIAAQNISESLFGRGGPLGGIPTLFGNLFGGGGGGATGAAALTGAGATLNTAGLSLTASAAELSAAAGALGAGGALGGGGSFPFGSFSDLFGGEGFAGGGDPPIGRWSLVGERGPEVFMPKSAGTIIPNEVLRSRRAARGGHTFNVNVMPGASRASAEQAAAAIAREVNRARRVS